jgi:protein-S-isoprenylcysteine O-methyltransferase Ste14
VTIFIIIWSLWFISEILLNRLFRSGIGDKMGQDRGTIRIIWITIVVANSLGIISAVFIRILISRFVIVPYIGLVLIIFGMIFRFISILSLGKLFTVDVTIRNNHKLKKTGIYHIIRHPSYLGSILSFIGFGISLNNWISLLIISIMVTIAMLNRIKVEERMLTEQFGKEYLEYMKKTYCLFPWIY